jgi:5-methylcytosine-specific restriction endonuclease McrA
MSISGRRPSRPITGPTKLRTVSKIRRDRETAYTNDWDAIAYEVKRRAGFRCQKCGSAKGPLEADHIIPVAKGGPTVFFNLQCVCLICHSKRPGHKHLFKKRTLGMKKSKLR